MGQGRKIAEDTDEASRPSVCSEVEQEGQLSAEWWCGQDDNHLGCSARGNQTALLSTFW